MLKPYISDVCAPNLVWLYYLKTLEQIRIYLMSHVPFTQIHLGMNSFNSYYSIVTPYSCATYCKTYSLQKLSHPTSTIVWVHGIGLINYLHDLKIFISKASGLIIISIVKTVRLCNSKESTDCII